MGSNMNLKVITSTTRPERKGLAIAEWILSLAEKEGSFNTELLDLAEINLPLMDEPNHPRLGHYQHQHTKDWSAKISSGDAFVMYWRSTIMASPLLSRML
jgi:NAD(P)H-dependent FMN reductase